jgi:hypothetical protein
MAHGPEANCASPDRCINHTGTDYHLSFEKKPDLRGIDYNNIKYKVFNN